MNHGQIVSFLWGVADLIRDTFRRGKYQDVILPLTVLRRLDCVLEPTKQKVLQRHADLESKKAEGAAAERLLRKASGYAFYNTSRFDFDRLLRDAGGLKANLYVYIDGFSPNMLEVLDRFDFRNTIEKLDEAGLLFKVIERFKAVDLHPDIIDNATMGTIFEELIRKFNEALNENPGEHFTPRDVVHLMVEVLLSGDEERLSRPDLVVKVCDPCCGSGGMLTIAKEQIEESDDKHAEVHLFGQEVNPETYAICKSDLFMKSESGRDGENIAYGSTLAVDWHASRRFEYLIANPPYGKDWKRDEEDVRAEHDRGEAGRFPAGLPRISDGQLLFLQHMVSRMAPTEEGGGRVAIIMNGSPLFTGDAGSGESEIRRWVLENDWLEAIIALPEQLFYNTGIATYVWVITNRKAPERKGKVQLIDATTYWAPGAAADNRRSLGDKRRHVPEGKAAEIVATHRSFGEGEHSKVFDRETFGYRKVTIDRPLRLNFQASPDRIARLDDQKAFQNLAISKKKDAKVKGAEEEAGRQRQDELRILLGSLPDDLFKDRAEFIALLDQRLKDADLKLAAPVKRAVLAALSERDQTAAVCVNPNGNPEPDPELRDFERVPLGESVRAFFDREVKPYVEDAWINESVRDPKDGEIGKVGYEINFNRYFYVYEPPRPLSEIKDEIRKLEKEIVALLQASSRGPSVADPVRRGVRHAALRESGVPWIGKVPRHWEVRRIKQVARLASGHTPNRSEPTFWVDPTIPWFQLTDIWQFRDDVLEEVHETTEMISEVGLRHSAAELLPAGTVALSRTASVGFSAILGRDMATTQDFANWVPGPLVRSPYLLYVLRAMRPELERLRFGSTHKTIYMPDIRNLVMPLPPIEEQDEIVAHIRRESSTLLEAKARVQRALGRLHECRASLITGAVTGQLEPEAS